MLKASYIEGELSLTLEPAGPLLIKAGDTGGADPTRPDMEFVRTRHRGVEEVYLPGPSLKGTVRAQAERIARSLDRPGRNPSQNNPPLADNPLGNGERYQNLDDMRYNSGAYLASNVFRDSLKESDNRTAIVYRRSAFVSQLFGHTSLAGRIRFADAYGENIVYEQRNGVAIDRVYGSVAVGPFNYETVISGTFTTTIAFKNVTLAHLALLGLALRDLVEGRVAIGFGKSRGLGRMRGSFGGMTIRYPTCERVEGELRLFNGRLIDQGSNLVGVGAFERDEAYGFSDSDRAVLPPGLSYQDDDWGFGVQVRAASNDDVRALFKACMSSWRDVIGLPA